MHPRAISVEDPRNLYADSILTVVIEEQCFRAAFTFVIARAKPDRVDVSPICFCLGMYFRIAINLTGRRLQNLGFDPLSKSKHVDCTVDACFGRLHRLELVMDGRSGASEVIDFVYFDG